jgi:hypothetical protein
MKPLIIVLALAALTGCATQPGYYSYNPRYTDPNGWQTVSVTPVPLGTGARVAAAGPVANGDHGVGTATSAQPAYIPPPATTTVVTQPVYVAPPVYAPAPVYAAPYPSYWWPPISIGLGFNWSHWSGGHGGGWHGGHGGHSGGGWHHR